MYADALDCSNPEKPLLMKSSSRLDLRLPLLSASLLLAHAALGQTAAAPPALAAGGTLRASSRIVVIDVGVMDGHGDPVKNLKASDFTLKEGGQPQAIAHFEAHTALTPAESAKLPELPKLDSNTFTNYTPVPANGALNVLLLDALNTPMKDQAYVRGEMLKYLKSARPGTPMAIFGLTSRLQLLQGFTSDPEILRKAVASGKNGPQASPLMDNPVGGDGPGTDDPLQSVFDSLGNEPGTAAVVASLQQFEAQTQSYQLQLRTQYTLDAMNSLARYLSGLPGRKNLIWFSGSFPINIEPDGDLTNPFAVMADMSKEFHETTSLLARSQVAVYPIDARGLMTAPMLDASNSGAKYAAHNPSAMMKDQQKFFANTAGEQSTMFEMAQDTGGKAFVNTNGLAEAVQEAIDAGANYYTLVYTPTNKDWNGDFRKVQVSVAKAGPTLTYRHGYYADDPDAAKKGDAKVSASEDAPLLLAPKPSAATGGAAAGEPAKPGAAAANGLDPAKAAMRSAMQFGGPDPTEILFKALINPATGQPETAVAPGNRMDPKVSGPYERYVIYLAAVPSDFSIAPTAAGKHHLAVELVVNLYNANGDLLNNAFIRATGDLDDAHYNGLMRGGVQFKQEISVPVKGQTFLRVGVHDLTSDHVGAIEVPVSTLAKLKPLPAPAAAPAAPAGSLAAPAAPAGGKPSLAPPASQP